MCRALLTLACLALLLHPASAPAQSPAGGVVTGVVTDAATHAPLEDANVILRNPADSTRVAATHTAKNGSFRFAAVAWGSYRVECGQIGHTSFRTAAFTLDSAHAIVTLKPILLRSSALLLDEVVVSSEKNLFGNAIDRRVYNVDHDLLARSSSASEVLQNIPSVQVDLDGNVSLRGSPDVMILVNGKKSPLMGATRADILSQLPAANIEKIEVITNPSARFTPEGTSGILNIVLKKGAGAVTSADVTGHLGSAARHNENLGFAWHPSRLDVFGNYGYRSDQRHRTGTDDRVLSAPGPLGAYREDNFIDVRPRVHMATLGLVAHADPKNTFELSSDLFHRRPTRVGSSTIVTHDPAGGLISDHDRNQNGFETETEAGVTAAFEHDYPQEDRQVRIEANASHAPQSETAHFAEHWRTPVQPDPASDIVLQQHEDQGHLTLDYTDPFAEDAKFEAGYALEVHRQDIESDADSLDVAQGTIVANAAKSYRFRLDQVIHAAYATYERALGKRWSGIAGVRAEYASVSSDLVSQSATFRDTYAGLYPTLHLNYKASASQDLQLSYSRRIRRPESDDLNPFPEYTDPYNIDSGNPRLRPESTHSIELGYRLRGGHLTFSPSLYLRDKHDGFTRVTKALNDSTFLRTRVNLATDLSAGLEPVITLSMERLQANLNGNLFYEQIDASNLGYAGKRSVVSWSGTFHVTVSPRRSTLLEVNSNYRSARLTPQGDARPSFVLNLGAKQDLLGDRVSATLALSDVLKTQSQDSALDVAGIHQHVLNRRDTRVFYAGLTWHLGRAEKKKDKAIQYEDAP